MRPKRINRLPQFWAKLEKRFLASADHFNLTPAEREAAWESAKVDPARAMQCYTIIANSLKEG